MPFPHVITYVPGPSTAVVLYGAVLLVDADPTDPVVTACRAALLERGSDGALAALAVGASPAPSFALAATEDDGLRLIVGGRGQAEFAGGVAATVTAAGSPSWLDQRLDNSPELRLSLVDPVQPVPSWPTLPIEAGTVLAAALIVPAVGARPVDPDATTGPFPAVAPQPPPAPPPAAPPPAGPPTYLPAQPPAAGQSPMVQAVMCASGHLNAPFVVGACRVCGSPVPAQEPFPAPRPTLGVLVLASGETVPVDRDVLLGRAPYSVDAGPRIVTLPSPENDLSRTHVRVAIDGWLVQVTDLGSTNGTVVTMPGQQDVRLRAHEPFVLVPGTVLNLADEALVRFEVPV
ncbi:FHA domain-containing protein [uncultured Jatrophihabitans sp.]|uniref:FHA domain-containing protein n=1 Tax=uncultured Jatrophihabitans sp. TaxID=1610747 RepID=UPI0035C94964